MAAHLLTAQSHAGGGSFTMIESTTTPAFVVVSAAAAMPSCREYIRRGARAAAQTCLQDEATRQYPLLVDRRAFLPDLVTLDVPVTSSEAGAYDFELTLSAGPPRGFPLHATPKGLQGCGVLSIDQAGAKTAANPGCW